MYCCTAPPPLSRLRGLELATVEEVARGRGHKMLVHIGEVNGILQQHEGDHVLAPTVVPRADLKA